MHGRQRFLQPEPITLLLLLVVLAWDASGLDVAAAGIFGTASGFPMRDHWFFQGVLHQGGRVLAWVAALWVLAGTRWPTGWLRRLDARGRVQLALTTVAAALLISALKRVSTTSCPSDLALFGGAARYVSHWAWFAAADGGGGHCFPAGHASAAFAFVGGYFAFVRRDRAIAFAWLAIALAGGLAIGLAQQVRGAHYLSHTLWTAWLCWAVALGIDRLFAHRRRRREALPA